MRRRFSSGLFWLLLFTLILMLVACNRSDGSINESRGVTVGSIQVATQGENPIQAQATVNGNLNDNCTTVTGVNVQRQDRLFVLDVQTVFNDTGECAEAVVAFSQPVALDVLNLPAGDYTVTADGINQTFNLPVDNIFVAETQAVTPPTTSLTTAVTSALAGQSVALAGQGFPANAQVEISMGLANGNRNAISTIPSGADGTFTTQVVIPANSTPNEQWVFGATVNGTTTLSNLVTVVTEVTQPTEPGQSGGGVNVPSNGLFTKTYIYMISLNDGGSVGCNDSVVPVAIDIDPTAAVMTAAYNRLLSIKDQNYGEQGYYNALYQSNLTLAGINIVNGEAIVSLTGTLTTGGECDDPRVIAQLEQTALQYSTVDRVTIYLNGELKYPPGGRG